MPSVGSALWRSLRAYQVYGANTDVGKTIASAILCKALRKQSANENVCYIKPVSTGPQSEADDLHISRYARGVLTKCLFRFDDAVSPHIAARSLPPPSDAAIVQAVCTQMSECAQNWRQGTVLVETAGGVHSPTPSGSSQADMYRPLRLPVILIADHRLGGISSSISAFESLRMRGYDIDSVFLFENTRYQNHEYLRGFFVKHSIPTVALPPPPPRQDSASEDEEAMDRYYEAASSTGVIRDVVSSSAARHLARIEDLQSMAERAHEKIWYPFTQHQDLLSRNIMTIDSAYKDDFQNYNPTAPETVSNSSLIQPTFDGSASWWTQGIGHGDPTLSLSAAYAAGRYGHVMFAGGIHEPAISLAELLLQHLANPRLKKVFYSDNGSTGMEVALKMALHATCVRYGWDVNKKDLGILGLKGSYHGDTIGAMDCSEPSTYNEKVEWYRGRGHWFDFPKVMMVKGQWVVHSPSGMEAEFGLNTTFSTLAEVFDVETRDNSPAALKYKKYITATLENLVCEEGRKFGALMFEPVILGAGGMLLVDPLFQRCLVQVVRDNPQLFGHCSPANHLSSTSVTSPGDWTGLPVIFDEVFTGLYRLGRFSSASFLKVHPDISVHAKLLTGGLVPLCTTLASESIFGAFLGADKSDALLHGHSYTAHAVGCNVARTAVGMMLDMEEDGAWDEYKWSWVRRLGHELEPEGSVDLELIKGDVWSNWSKGFVTELSHREKVEGVVALGSVLAITLRDDTNAGE
ncbi:onanonoxo-7-onima-8-eninoihtemlysoneda [Lasallia pustulata]|uniref:Onanonoxo-7-onima-8-eninoihtemlysoneda n=1 Tax=Lasallia pustulata TaxID=136370 RepID=A0A1W5CWZ8_9LECA|nr:onanonoxo-7-onima-8-eninoihtemlysoneda [Lasallia pustulata]